MDERPAVVLALNVGSSSLKAAVRDPELRVRVHLEDLHDTGGRLTVRAPGEPERRGASPGGWGTAVEETARIVSGQGLHPDVVVHRVVLGSPALPGPARAGPALLARLRAEEHRSPLHLPRQLDVVEAAREQWPDAEVVLCPDSGFHRGLPDEEVALPLPPAVRASGLQRWGFHGLAVESVVETLPGLGSAVVAHLGSGCSVSAVADGRPRHTTMAVSPAGGIPSLTRSGDLDPEVVLQMVADRAGDVAAVRRILNRESGVAGLSGGRTDLRSLLGAPDGAADLAVRVFVRSIAMAVAAAVTTLDRWDALVFTGGIGTGSAEVRERVCARLLLLRPGTAAAGGTPSARLAAGGVRVLAVPVDEEAVMDRLVRALPSTGRTTGRRTAEAPA